MIALLFVIGLRVVSLAPNITEIIYAIGADSELVGVVTPCDYPPGIDKPIVGSFMVPNYEKIQVLKPDIVLITVSYTHLTLPTKRIVRCRRRG